MRGLLLLSASDTFVQVAWREHWKITINNSLALLDFFFLITNILNLVFIFQNNQCMFVSKTTMLISVSCLARKEYISVFMVVSEAQRL